MKADQFPISRKTMYSLFFLEDILFLFFRWVVMDDLGLSYHITMFIATFVAIVIIWEFVLLTGRLFENNMPFASHAVKRLTIQVLLTFVVIILVCEPVILGSEALFDFTYPALVRKFQYLLYFMTSVITCSVYFGLIYFQNWKRNLVSMADMQREQAVVRYDLLKNQINPHFLFNALTSLNGLMFENPSLASDFLQQLSKVYRYVLQHKERETVSIQTELQFINNYILLLKTRFNKAIEFDINLDERAQKKEIVPVTLQILFENAMKHNVMSVPCPLNITVTADDTFLIIQNNLNLRDHVESSNHIGLESLKTFYRYLTSTVIEIDKSDKFFTVKVPLI